jgi:hypothetical protein
MRDPSAQGRGKILSRDRLPVKSWLHDDEFFVSFVIFVVNTSSNNTRRQDTSPDYLWTEEKPSQYKPRDKPCRPRSIGL